MSLQLVNGYYLKFKERGGFLSYKGDMTREKILNNIKKYARYHKYAPTIREICDAIGIKSTSTIHRHLEVLRIHGDIEWEPTLPRTLRVIKK